MTLPAPYYHDDDNGVVLYHGDCLELLPLFEPGSVDAVVTDPPYGIGFRNNEWDSSLPSTWLSIARRTCGLTLCFCPPTIQWDYPRPDWVCCWHRFASMSRAATGGFNHWSPLLVYGKAAIPVDTYVLNAMARGETFNGHPTPKPLPLMRWVVGLTDAACTVCDPFAGSGTTLVACLRTGRRGIGIEISRDYCEIAVERLRKEKERTVLFDQPRRKQRELELTA